MKILDKYLIKQFLQAIILGLISFTILFVVIDAMEKLDDFIDQDVPTINIIHYYVVFAPEILKLITPVSVLFAALFTAGKSANLSELTAIRASGVSIYRFMAPFVVTAFIISILSIYFGGYVVPMANKTKIHIEQKYLKKGISYSGSNIYFQDSQTKIVSIAFFDPDLNNANRVSIQDFVSKKITKMNSRIDTENLRYDTLNGNWIALKGIQRFFNDSTQSAIYFDSLVIKNLHFKPDDLIKKQRKPQEMNLSELSELIETQIRSGNDPTSAEIEYHSRIAFAFANFIIVLFGLPISANKRKGGVAVQVGVNILITFIYLVFMKVSQAFGKNDALDPILTAWFANLIFLAGAFITIPNMRN